MAVIACGALLVLRHLGPQAGFDFANSFLLMLAGIILLVVLALDRLALDVQAVITVSHREIHFEPGGFFLRRILPAGSLYTAKRFRWDEWDVRWREEDAAVLGSEGRYPVGLVEAQPCQAAGRVQAFRVHLAMPSIAHLRELIVSQALEKLVQTSPVPAPVSSKGPPETRAAAGPAGFLIGLTIAIWCAVLVAVVPMCAEVFRRYGLSVKGATKQLIDLSALCRGHLFLCVLICCVVGYFLTQLSRPLWTRDFKKFRIQLIAANFVLFIAFLNVMIFPLAFAPLP
jgi:hypothetical protein